MACEKLMMADGLGTEWNRYLCLYITLNFKGNSYEEFSFNP
jgi:hypothetical protein